MKYRYQELLYYPQHMERITDKMKEWCAIGIYKYNVSAMMRVIEEQPDLFQCEDQLVSELADKLYGNSDLEQEHVDRADLERPLILCEIAPQCYELIDGRHRIVKAQQKQITSLQVYKLSALQALPFMQDEVQQADYIGYWNRKIRQYDRCDQYNHYEKVFAAEYQERMMDATLIWTRLCDAVKVYPVEIMCWSNELWFSLYNISGKIYVAESSRAGISVKCKHPKELTIENISAVLSFFEGWYMGDKEVIALSKKQDKMAEYAFSVARLFSYADTIKTFDITNRRIQKVNFMNNGQLTECFCEDGQETLL